MSDTNQCSSMEQDLVLFLYDELPPARKHALDAHLGDCAGCRKEIAALRSTLDAVNQARLPERAERALPSSWDSEWESLRARLSAERPEKTGRAAIFSPWMKAAAVLLVAGASFAAGLQWDSLFQSSGSTRRAGAAGSQVEATLDGLQNSAERMQEFSEQTHGYLNRSRLVLLEFANTPGSGDPTALRNASLSLLRETKAAQRVAGELADPRIEDLLAQVESILREISRLTEPGDTTTLNRIRTEVNNSGVLIQLELLNTGPTRPAQERS